MKDKIIKILKSLGIRAGICLAISMVLSLVGVLLVCGTFVFSSWLIATLAVFGFALVSALLPMLFSHASAAVSKVLTTVYSFLVVSAIFSLLFYALICSKFNFSDMNWQEIFKGFLADKLFYLLFLLVSILFVAGYYGFVNRDEFGDLFALFTKRTSLIRSSPILKIPVG